ncbi:MAG: hypothetical protein H6994_18510 [Pseudomonadales bacterium]|nr:hypothetical protein [Pseudomonadales bacterium]
MQCRPGVVRRYGLLLLVMLIPAMPAWSAIREVQVQPATGDTWTVALGFDGPVQLVPQPAWLEGASVAIRLRGIARAGGNAAAESLDMRATGTPLRELQIVSTTGEQFSAVLNFTEAMRVQLLPQLDPTQLMVQVAPLAGLATPTGDAPGSGWFALELMLRDPGLPAAADVPAGLPAGQVLYVLPDAGRYSERLRTGFFASRRAALVQLALLRAQFPDARLLEVSAAETHFAQASRINPPLWLARAGRLSPQTVALGETATVLPRVAPAEPAQSTPELASPGEPGAQAGRLAEADAAYQAGDYERAVRLFEALRRDADSSTLPHVLEFLGMAREARKQYAHATEAWRDFLYRFAGDVNAARVRQRLDTLIALTSPRHRQGRAPLRRPDAWRHSLAFSQFYRRHSLDINGDTSVPISGLISDVDLSVSQRSAGFSHEGRLSISHLADFSGQDSGRDLRVSNAWWETWLDSIDTGVRVGRQSNYEAGVIGRFDGLGLQHRFTDEWQAGLLGGWLIDSSFEAPDPRRPFVGLSGRYSAPSGRWSLSPFYIRQEYDGYLDREAVGAQAQWQSPDLMAFARVDYDLHQQALNNIMFMANTGMGRESSWTFTYDYRRSPYLSTRNALIGQPFADLSDLELELVALKLEDLAKDRTLTTQSLRLGWNGRFSKFWEMSIDASASSTDGTAASMDVPAYDGYSEVYLSTQIRLLEPYGPATYTGFTVRFAGSDTSTTTSVYWDNRLRVGERLWLYPRIRVDRRIFGNDNLNQNTIRPSLRLDWRRSNAFWLELEAGYDYTARETNRDDITVKGYFINIGYRAVF